MHSIAIFETVRKEGKNQDLLSARKQKIGEMQVAKDL